MAQRRRMSSGSSEILAQFSKEMARNLALQQAAQRAILRQNFAEFAAERLARVADAVGALEILLPVVHLNGAVQANCGVLRQEPRAELAVARLALRFGVLDGLAAVDGRAGAGRPPSTDAAPVRR